MFAMLTSGPKPVMSAFLRSWTRDSVTPLIHGPGSSIMTLLRIQPLSQSFEHVRLWLARVDQFSRFDEHEFRTGFKKLPRLRDQDLDVVGVVFRPDLSHNREAVFHCQFGGRNTLVIAKWNAVVGDFYCLETNRDRFVEEGRHRTPALGGEHIFEELPSDEGANLMRLIQR